MDQKDSESDTIILYYGYLSIQKYLKNLQSHAKNLFLSFSEHPLVEEDLFFSSRFIIIHGKVPFFNFKVYFSPNE